MTSHLSAWAQVVGLVLHICDALTSVGINKEESDIFYHQNQ